MTYIYVPSSSQHCALQRIGAWLMFNYYLTEYTIYGKVSLSLHLPDLNSMVTF